MTLATNWRWVLVTVELAEETGAGEMELVVGKERTTAERVGVGVRACRVILRVT